MVYSVSAANPRNEKKSANVNRSDCIARAASCQLDDIAPGVFG
jgi:hypothetical protein